MVIRLIVHTQGQSSLNSLEDDLKHFFPGIRLVAVEPDHCQWEGIDQGDQESDARVKFLHRCLGQVEVEANPAEHRLLTDIYNVGLLESPSVLLSMQLKDFSQYQVGDIIVGPCHHVGKWWQIVTLDSAHQEALCLPAVPPADYVPRFLYRVERAGGVEHWCPDCWKEPSLTHNVSKLPVFRLDEPRICVMCGRDFCADDACAPDWAEYTRRSLWRRPLPVL